MTNRNHTLFDQLLINFDTGLRTVTGAVHTTGRTNPAAEIEQNELNASEKELSGRFMRINHAGEVAAQGLYQGQALTAKLPQVREQMEQAAKEENDHLDWCRSRAQQLGTHTSYLDPFWYAGSVAIGAIAGLAGDKWSLGFVTETERQVVKHLDSHLQQLSKNDEKSRAILEQMKIDEGHHATTAQQAGGAELPKPVKTLMSITSKIMTKSAYHL